MRKSTGKAAEFHAEWSKKFCDVFVSLVKKYEDWGQALLNHIRMAIYKHGVDEVMRNEIEDVWLEHSEPHGLYMIKS